jgi:hypothetical protein
MKFGHLRAERRFFLLAAILDISAIIEFGIKD